MSKGMFSRSNGLLAKGEAELLDQQNPKRKESSLSSASEDEAETNPHYTKSATKFREKRWKKTVVHENEDHSLTDTQFEETVQSVLLKPLESSGKRVTLVESEGEESRGRETLKTSPTAKAAVLGKATPWKEEEPEGDNGGRQENRKGVSKKKVPGNACMAVDGEEVQEEEEADQGSSGIRCTVWVQCSFPSCEKWRRLSSDTDPSALPDDWSCRQNTDLQHNRCSIPEEKWSGAEHEVVYAVYIPGSIVWAKQYGYPWWPGMVEADPDIGEYFLFTSKEDSLPSKYHVTFFGHSATRAWISASMLRSFDDPNTEGFGLRKTKSDKKKLEAAVRMAEEAEKINLQERRKKFGFENRFGGKEFPNSQRDCKDALCRPCAERTLKRSRRSRAWEKSQGKAN